ncbi:hypothetical protein ES319_D04G182100v1 [Gossypium barbadense]|uniref:Dirigent protein n=1 Tax=Gossypium barbadense TaxID=3634 RepID=A0A5J5S1R0_GOSBA|nr:hypothetical protein ES319_D04G182100v1 [Gossypium barbadense]PPD69683.1 hypothetical protein GOBAR_DD33436 [Gossypium barbadense]
MASSMLKTHSFILFLILFFITVIAGRRSDSEVFGKYISISSLAEAPLTNCSSPLIFGDVYLVDDPLTIEPDVNSKMVGKAQGSYVVVSQGELSLLMVLNFAFTEGKYNGSTLSVLGRNEVLSAVREMPIVGGSGVFRFARGYAQAKTHSITQIHAIVEYNVFVFHYC